MKLKKYIKTEHGDWNELVFSCSTSDKLATCSTSCSAGVSLGTCAFHSSQWHNALEHAFRQYKKARFVMLDEDELIGVLPGMVFNPIPMVKMWHSMPWNLFGGPVFRSDVDVDLRSVVEAIDQRLSEFADQNSICETQITLSPQVEVKIRNTQHETRNTKHEMHPQLCTRLNGSDRFTHLLKTKTKAGGLSYDYDVIWKNYNKRVRGAIRKAKKCGVVVYDSDSIDELRTFYEIYLASMERFGSTPKPFSILRFLQESDIAKLAIAKFEGKIIAGLLYLFFDRTVTLWCGASMLEHRNVRPNNAIFHHIIKWATENGYDWVDFGASPPDNKGLIAFKEEWRAKRYDFESYIKVHSPLRRKLWTGSEQTLRKVYSAVQKRGA